tara:strand:+ start:341 stop:463 length:123 start_codon:yes stop_codon:yes gene_type:complete
VAAAVALRLVAAAALQVLEALVVAAQVGVVVLLVVMEALT